MRRIKVIPFKRKRTGKTDYRKRIRFISSNKPRLIIRKSLKNISLQIVEFHPTGDKVLLAICSSALKKYGWKASNSNLPAAYLIGLLLGLKAKKSKIDEVILDLGLYTSVKGSVLYSAMKGVVDAGLNVPHSNEVLPSEDRIKGVHISNYAKLAKEPQFLQYKKDQLNPEELPKHFEDIKTKIMKE
ncbi:50S ribosomal protein L18 [archaeon]|nr:50S ribosomal protein L18 [archaeon]|tara:strand:+ start:3607 stop:4164 length:558 start_codon:yes stop_codon:yes gene_type:complete